MGSDTLFDDTLNVRIDLTGREIPVPGQISQDPQKLKGKLFAYFGWIIPYGIIKGGQRAQKKRIHVPVLLPFREKCIHELTEVVCVAYPRKAPAESRKRVYGGCLCYTIPRFSAMKHKYRVGKHFKIRRSPAVHPPDAAGVYPYPAVFIRKYGEDAIRLRSIPAFEDDRMRLIDMRERHVRLEYKFRIRH